jgi:hypothetical protein
MPLYFFGSIIRSDFIKGKSDLDIEVFSDNINSTIYKVDHLLDYYYKNKDPRYIVFKIKGTPISGYKYYFKNSDIFFDFSVYKKESQEIILEQRNIEKNIPFALTIFLITIKYLYYYLNVISKQQYSFLKKKMWDLYNPENTPANTYDKEYYMHYIHSENGSKKYLV